MFGFSIQKLLILAAIIGAVWYGFKFVGRLQEMREAEEKTRGGHAPKRGWTESLRDWAARRSGDVRGGGELEETVQCPKCGAYVAVRGATSCGRADCPY